MSRKRIQTIVTVFSLGIFLYLSAQAFDLSSQNSVYSVFSKLDGNHSGQFLLYCSTGQLTFNNQPHGYFRRIQTSHLREEVLFEKDQMILVDIPVVSTTCTLNDDPKTGTQSVLMEKQTHVCKISGSYFEPANPVWILGTSQVSAQDCLGR